MKLKLFFFFALFAFHTATACEFDYLFSKANPVRNGIMTKRFPVPSFSAFSYTRLASMNFQYAQSFGRPNFRVIPVKATIVRSYTSEFDRTAIFCRMENYMLTTTGVKLCVRAGGYSEK